MTIPVTFTSSGRQGGRPFFSPNSMRRAYGGSSRPATSWQRTASAVARPPFPHHPRQQQQQQQKTYQQQSVKNERAYFPEDKMAQQQQQQQGQYPHYPPRQHHHHQAYRSSSALQTITSNQYSNVLAQPPKEQQPEGAQEKATPKQQKPSAKKSSNKMTFPLLKSPITMCFERMLGAADFIAQNPQVVAKEEKQQNKTAPRRGSKRKSVDGATQEKSSKPKKRLSTVNTAPVKASDLAPGNPFLEILQDPDLHHQVVLQMALQREPSNKEIPASPPSIIPEGFYWRDYPVLEQILFDNMAEYYHISSLNRQSKFQQSFNNKLVGIIKQKASESGLSFDEMCFDDKKLRDRVRCFFKTHLQNAKKRLATLQKHPESEEHQKQLRNYIKCAKEQPLLEMFEKLPKKRRKASVAPVV